MKKVICSPEIATIAAEQVKYDIHNIVAIKGNTTQILIQVNLKENNFPKYHWVDPNYIVIQHPYMFYSLTEAIKTYNVQGYDVYVFNRTTERTEYFEVIMK